MKTHSYTLVSTTGPSRPARRFGRLAALLILGGSMLLGGCLVHTAEARLPAAPVMTRGVAPAPGYVWVKGHHRYVNGRYLWRRGRWIAPVRGKRWVRGHYVTVRRGKLRIRRWVPGQWRVSRVVVRRPTVKIVTRPLPVKRRLVIPARPGAGYVWVKGFYTFRNGRYAWTRGRWMLKAAGKRWIPGRYVWIRRGPFKIRKWVAGHWKRVAIAPSTPVRIVLRPIPRTPRMVRTRRPGPKFVWVRGHHVFRKGRYQWVRGRWVRRMVGKRWISGRYRMVRRGNFRVKVWVRGHWR